MTNASASPSTPHWEWAPFIGLGLTKTIMWTEVGGGCEGPKLPKPLRIYLAVHRHDNMLYINRPGVKCGPT